MDGLGPNVTVVVDGRTLDVTISTYGNGCYSGGGTQFSISGSTVTVVPHDRFRRDPVGCTLELRRFQHSVRVEVPAAGEYTVVVRGREEPSHREIELRRSVVVD